MGDTFVGREAELDTLGSFLHLSLNKSTQVCFVIGESGTGKTRLIEEFVRRSETLSDDLLFVKGNCNAQSGISDPYLPFRSILGMLSGDHTNAITRNNAQRLSSVLRTSGRALVEVAPELVGTLIPGASILIALARLGAKEKGWLKALEERAQDSERNANDIKQSEIFFQYTAFLRDLAKTNPLVIILDDLQWVDASSNALFFHLARELKDTPILLIGTYRPNDVTMGRDGDRHPLEQTLNEVKRLYGDIWIDLDASMHQNGRAFVESLVNSEPNSLNSKFIDALFAKTGGHALFTAELLSSMQERGDLIQDANGLWQESSQLDWNDLPARVEAIVAERIERLEDDLREILDIACVEGQDFTAQIIARIQGLKDREVIRKLSRELDRCHRLVQDAGEIPVGDTFLSRYTFNHALFQAYLYSELSKAERRLFHSEIARLLESIYSENLDNIAIQLARHFLESGDSVKSAIYLEKAGESAFNIGELIQAQKHFCQALEMLDKETSGQNKHQKSRLQWQIGRVLYHTGYYDSAESYYRLSSLIAKEIKERQLLAQSLIDLSQTLRRKRETEEALRTAFEALEVLKDFQDLSLESQALRVVSIIYGQMDKTEERLKYVQKALELARKADDTSNEMACLNNLGVLAGVLGDAKKALEYYTQAWELAKRKSSLTSQSLYLGNIAGSHRKLGNYQLAEKFHQKDLDLRVKLGKIPSTASCYLQHGIIYLSTGDNASAIRELKRSIKIADLHGRITTQVNSRCRLMTAYLAENCLDKVEELILEVEPLSEKFSPIGGIYTYLLLTAILSLRKKNNLNAKKLAISILEESNKKLLGNRRWTCHYHRAFAASILVLTLEDQQANQLRQATKYFEDAVEICGWVGVLDDALMILKEIQKVDPGNLLKPIETYLREKREIAWKNRPYSD